MFLMDQYRSRFVFFFCFNTDLIHLIVSKIFQRMNLTGRSLMAEATALPSVPLPLPINLNVIIFFVLVTNLEELID